MSRATPHGDKLQALIKNAKLPAVDRPRVRSAIQRYHAWVAELEAIEGTGDALLARMVASLTRYKTSIDLDLVFDSEDDFLYRQKGQLKLDNTILEEFMPWLVGRVLSDLVAGRGLTLGPANCFAQLRFDSDLPGGKVGGGMGVRSKDQDFVMARPLFLKASHDRGFKENIQAQTHLAYVAAEIKTNLDKTMFQEAVATANDLRGAVPNSQYFLLCEWLDMTPISSSATSIQEVIVLRKAKRLSANIRGSFSTAAGRRASRDKFRQFLAKHPFAPNAFGRFLGHIRALLGDGEENEDLALGRGWF